MFGQTFLTGSLSIAAAAKEIRPALFNVIHVKPSDRNALRETFQINEDGDGLGEELPPSISYFKKSPKDFSTYLAVTDLSLCRRPREKEICQSFVDLIDGKNRKAEADITGSRIFGSGSTTHFVTALGDVKVEWADSSIAFLAIDWQDLANGPLSLYVYAKKGTNLVQLSRRLSISCFPKKCPEPKKLEIAKAESKKLLETFAIE